MSRGSDLFIAYQFIKRLSIPFNKTKAFRAGLIDAKGNTLRKAKTPAEKVALTPFDRLTINIKKIMNKAGLGGQAATIGAAMLMIKESNIEDDSILLTDGSALEQALSEQIKNLQDDAPTNASLGGLNVAGLDDNPPAVPRSKKMLRRNKTFIQFVKGK